MTSVKHINANCGQNADALTLKEAGDIVITLLYKVRLGTFWEVP
jgi:hypothetical protein